MPRDIRAGLCFGGSPSFRGDRTRSIHELDVLRSLVAVPGVHWTSLQVGPRAGQAAELGLAVAEFSDYLATAKAIHELDLVVTTCTSVAHLAGGMGWPTWVMLEFHAEWRWGQHPTETPWYPSARLFRQTTPGDWAGVVSRVIGALVALRHEEAA